jgi:hypothetical protein
LTVYEPRGLLGGIGDGGSNGTGLAAAFPDVPRPTSAAATPVKTSTPIRRAVVWFTVMVIVFSF